MAFFSPRSVRKIPSVLLGLTAVFVSSVWADDFVPEVEEVIQTSADNFILNSDDSAGDVELQFGSALAEILKWDSVNSRFSLSDSLSFEDNQVVDVRLENLAAAPTCDNTVDGKIYFNTTDDLSYVCNGSTWVPLEGGDGSNPPYVENDSVGVSPGATFNVSILGSGFSPATTVDIPGFTGTIDSVTVVSPNQIDLTLTAGAAGTFDLVLTNGIASNTIWPGNGIDFLNVELVTGTGPAGTYNESFETGGSDWVDSGLDVAWTRDNNGTPSNNTGPNNASVGNFYTFTEASNPNFPGRTFGIETTNFNVAQSISFDYHMFGADMGDLELQYLRSGVWTTINTISGQQQTSGAAAYLTEFVDLSGFQVEALRFLYTSGNGFTGDCALDNISIISN